MRLASVTRATLNEEEKQKLKELCCGATEKPNEIVKELYLQELKNGKHKPKCSEATWPLSAWQEEQHDVIIVESVGDEMDQKECTEDKTMKKTCYCAKLLQFHDNRRPPYWGTWRKKSKYEFFDYEVDSDSEWEDEEEGESLEGGDDADKEQSDEEEGVGENGYLLDNTFVPHGYLSDEEAQAKDEDISPEEQKLRMIILKEEFDEEMNQKAERLKPRLLGCIWISNEITDVGPGSHYEKLLIYRAVWDESSGPIDLQGLSCESPSPPTVPKKPFPQSVSVVEPLVKLVHGSQLPLSKLVNEFLTQLEKENPTQCVTKGAVTRKIKDIARRSYDRNGKQAW
ncbi:hypothetical protein AAG570_006312 [Ranatra chinensis]|uniref:Chromatin assembly factor 1 subunit A dimerization domain-containing protein n=1 Tax=Ranatra chinensis TaxID=642074 RepID=A0ABD0YU97_9HEMI